jgi:cysteinyl-tRNA synthetase
MVLKFLGEQIDIHTGGVDHINVHHTNEIAQSENYTGKTYSTFFCHNEFVNLNDQKMAKSAGEFITVQTLIDKNFNPLSFRYLTLQNQYRKKMNFTWDALQAAENALQKLQRSILNFTHTNTRELDENYLSEFKKSLEDDLNIPESLATLWRLVKDAAISENKKYWTALEMDRVLSLDLGKNFLHEVAPSVSDEIQNLLELRKKYRAEKNWAEADKIRDQLVKIGVEIKDK